MYFWNFLQGPVYDGNIERTHKYHERDHIKPDLKELNGPLYDIDREHFYEVVFLEEPEPAEEKRDLIGPIYKVPKRDHGYSEINKTKNTDMTVMAGPVYKTDR